MRSGFDELFILKAPEPPWGDYGHILIHGLSSRPGKNEKLHIERTGPFVPPVSFPGINNIVMTDDFRRLKPPWFMGCGWRWVVKHRIVHLDWRRWDGTADEPQEYPVGGEPEDYILQREHDEDLVARMPPLVELIIWGTPLRFVDGRLDLSNYGGQAVCHSIDPNYTIVSATFKAWLEEHVGEWVDFAPAAVA